jgi:hypothetical protein
VIECCTLAAKCIGNVCNVRVCLQCVVPLCVIKCVWRYLLLGTQNSSKICDTLFSA